MHILCDIPDKYQVKLSVKYKFERPSVLKLFLSNSTIGIEKNVE